MANLIDVVQRLKIEGEKTRSSNEDLMRTFSDQMQKYMENIQFSVDSLIEVVPANSSGGLEPENDEDDDAPDSKQKEEDKESRSILEAIRDSLDGLGKSLENFSDSVLKMAGDAASGLGLAGLALLFFKPELAMKILVEGIEIFNDAMVAVGDLMIGSTEGLKQFMENNPITTAIASSLIVVKTIGVVGSFLTSLNSVLGSVVAGFTKVYGIVASISSVVTLPMVAAIGGIALGLYSVYNGIKDAVEVFKETGSLAESFRAFAASTLSTLIGFPMDFIKGTVSIIADFFGFEEISDFLDSFSFQETIKENILRSFDMLQEAFVSLFEFIATIPEKISSFISESISGIPVIGEFFDKMTGKNEESSSNVSESETTSKGRISSWFDSITGNDEQTSSSATSNTTSAVSTQEKIKVRRDRNRRLRRAIAAGEPIGDVLQTNNASSSNVVSVMRPSDNPIVAVQSNGGVSSSALNTSVQTSGGNSLTSMFRSAQNESNALKNQTVSETSAAIPAILSAMSANNSSKSSGGSAVVNNTTISNSMSIDNLSREFVYRPS